MATLDQLAEAALQHDALAVRSLAMDLLQQHARLADLPQPASGDRRVHVVAAALIELLALRRHEPPPAWTACVEGLNEPFHLLESASLMPRLREMCERESPEPLRCRKLYAPADDLTFA